MPGCRLSCSLLGSQLLIGTSDRGRNSSILHLHFSEIALLLFHLMYSYYALFTGSTFPGLSIVYRQTGLLLLSNILSQVEPEDRRALHARGWIRLQQGFSPNRPCRMRICILLFVFLSRAGEGSCWCPILNPTCSFVFLQVLDEIVQILTEPRYMGKMLVILAGYEHQVRSAMRSLRDDPRGPLRVPPRFPRCVRDAIPELPSLPKAVAVIP